MKIKKQIKEFRKMEKDAIYKPIETEVDLQSNKYGKLYIKESWYTQDNIENISILFSKFIPTRVEYLYHSNIFEMFGFCEEFDSQIETEDQFAIYDADIVDGEVIFKRRYNIKK